MSQILSAHFIFHSGKKPYKFEECGKASYKMSYLTQHKFTHNGRNHTNVKNVENYLTLPDTLRNINQFILERNPTSVKTVTKNLELS